MSIDFIHSFLYYAVVALGEVLVLSAIIHMLYTRRTPTSMIAWLLSIAAFPYIAVPLYFIIGMRKHINKKSLIKMDSIDEKECRVESEMCRILTSNGISKPTNDNLVEIYTNGIKAYDVFVKSIENAKKSIYISTYLFEYDRVTRNIINLLSNKAKEGVDVRILLDSVGSYKFYFRKRYLKKMIESGVKIHFFMPILKMPFKNYINLRNHRKIYIFDERMVLSGGMNISNDYMGTKRYKPKWEDLIFSLRGSAVVHYLEIFRSDWHHVSQEEIDISIKSSDFENYNGECLQVVPSGPDIASDALYEALIGAIHTAKRRIWIVTPYFVPDIVLIRALIIAKHKGLDVKLITPKKSNHIIADLGRTSYMRELDANGVDVALYNGSMLHAKAVLFDNSSVMLGSVNFDNRSLFLNYEVASFSYSAKTIKDVEKWMSSLLLNSSSGIKRAGRIRLVLENLMRVFAPQL